MKRELVNPNSLQSKLDAESNKEAIEVNTLLQKLSKGKRRHELAISKANKKILAKIVKEIRELISSQGQLPKNFEQFLTYLEEESKTPHFLCLSYEELLFLRKVISISIRELMHSQLKWYQLIKRITISIMLAQYRNLLANLHM